MKNCDPDRFFVFWFFSYILNGVAGTLAAQTHTDLTDSMATLTADGCQALDVCPRQ